MLDLGAVNDLVGRAMIMGVKDDWLDRDKLVYYAEGKAFLNLDTYVTMVEGDIIEIPEGFWGVLMDRENANYQAGKAYQFIFPKDIHYVGGLNAEIESSSNTSNSLFSLRSSYRSASPTRETGRSMSGSVRITRMRAAAMNKYITTFANSTFDFSRCEHLNTVASYGFSFIQVKNVVFHENLRVINSYGFAESKIGTLSLTGLQKVGSYAFTGCKFGDLGLGTELTLVNTKGLCFDKPVDEIVMKEVESLDKQLFENVRNIYLPYNIYAGIDAVKEYMQKVMAKLNTGLYSMSEMYPEVNRIGSLVKDTCSGYVNLQDRLFDYNKLKTPDLARTIAEMLAIYIEDRQTVDCTFYLYLKDTGIDIRERNYTCIWESGITKLIADTAGKLDKSNKLSSRLAYRDLEDLLKAEYDGDFSIKVYIEQ